MPTLLFVTYGGGHVNMLIPLIERLRQRPGFNCVVLGLTTAAAQLAHHRIPCRGFASLLREGDEAALAHGERLTKLQGGGAVPRAESIAYLGLSYADLELRLGAKAAEEEFAAKGRQAFLPIGPLRRLFDEVNPDLLVTTISPRAEQASLLVARERSIPSLCLVDLFARPSLRRASEMGYGTRVCVISESVREFLLAAGRHAKEVVVTGNPVFDRLDAARLAPAAAQLRTARGWHARQVILWASQVEPSVNPFSGASGDPALPARIEAALVALLPAHSNWTLVVRRHPNEPPRALADSPQVVDGSRDDLHTLLAAVDLVVTMTSTVGLEARLLGKPLVSVDLSVFSADTPYTELGLSQGISSLDQLEPSLIAGLTAPHALSPGYPPPGRATAAILAQLDDLLNGVVG